MLIKSEKDGSESPMTWQELVTAFPKFPWWVKFIFLTAFIALLFADGPF